MFIANKIAFVIFLFLFLFIGTIFAKKNVNDKEKNKNDYQSIIICWPFGFLTSFFFIDPRLSWVFEGNRFESPIAFLVYWLIISSLGTIISLIASFLMIRIFKRGRSE